MESRKRISALPFFLLLLAFAGQAAADPWVGTWVRKSITGAPPDKAEFTCTVEKWGVSGYKLTYRLAGVQGETSVESAADGTDSPILINGKPSAQTMALKKVDDHHTYAVVKLNGKTYLTSRGTLSADSNTMTVEDEPSAETAGMGPGKMTEVWIRK